MQKQDKVTLAAQQHSKNIQQKLSPFLLLLKLLGLNPWTTSHGTGTSKLSSLFAVVTVLQMVLQAVAVVHCLYMYMRKISKEERNSFGGMELLCTGFYMLAAFCMAPFFAWNMQKLPSYLDDLSSFNSHRISTSQEKKLLKFLRVNGWCCVGSLVVMSAVVWYLNTADPSENLRTFLGWRLSKVGELFTLHLVLMFPFVLAMISRGIALICFLFIAAIISLRFRNIWQALGQLRSESMISGITLNGEEYGAKVEEITAYHFSLSKTTEALDDVFGPATFVYSASDTICIIVLISALIESALSTSGGSTGKSNNVFSSGNMPVVAYVNLFCIFGTLFYLSVRVCIASYAHSQAHGIIPVIHNCIETVEMDGRTRSKLSAILQRLRDNPVGFTGWGMFLIDKKFILTLAGVVITYLMVILQMGDGNNATCSLEKQLNNISRGGSSIG